MMARIPLCLLLSAYAFAFIPNQVETKRTLVLLDKKDDKLSSDDLMQRRQRLNQDNVNVNLVDNVDSVTLTAVGFGLIAFNFLVLANLGDGGVGGLVATVINTLKQ